MALAWQIILRCDDDRVLAPTTSHRRRMAASIGRVARPFELLAWSAPDTHLHALVAGDRDEAGELARRLLIGLIQVLGHPTRWERARIKPVEDQRHLRHAFRYVLRQAEHHGTSGDPWREASSLPDLLGLRTSARWTRAVVQRHLPRLHGRDLETLFPRAEAAPADLLAGLLPEAACAALALDTLDGRHRPARLGLAAAAQVGHETLGPGPARAVLGCSAKAWRNLRSTAAPVPVVDAIHRQWRLRSAVHRP